MAYCDAVPAMADMLERAAALYALVECPGTDNRCPLCAGLRYDGCQHHTADCPLGAWLREWRGEANRG